jgi:hypothetical protein
MWSRFPRFDVPYNLPVAVVLISFFSCGRCSVYLCFMRGPWLCEMDEAKEIEGDRVMILTERVIGGNVECNDIKVSLAAV